MGSGEAKIRRLSAEDMDAVCEVIGQAFADIPMPLRW
jgi:hypothetical protein